MPRKNQNQTIILNSYIRGIYVLIAAKELSASSVTKIKVVFLPESADICWTIDKRGHRRSKNGFNAAMGGTGRSDHLILLLLI